MTAFPIFDGHNDLLSCLDAEGDPDGAGFIAGRAGHIDLPRARAGGLAVAALLAGVRYQGGRRGHLLAFLDAAEGAESALARAMGEALVFSGIEAGELDVAFLRSGDPASQAMAKVGLRFDLPVPEVEDLTPAAPGMDPSRPPKLR